MRSAKPHIIVIDGKSGSGKTQLAAIVAEATGATVIHLDDVYPGWGGLASGRDQILDSVLEPLSRGQSGAYLSWDWVNGKPGKFVSVEPTDVVIVEGCGISTPASRAISDTVIWVDCPDDVRADRLRFRDGDRFESQLAGWEDQVAEHIIANSPDTTADVVVRTTTEQRVGG